MVTPTYLVQADLSGTAFGGSPTWTDITSYVLTTDTGQPISITVGRTDELTDISPSSCSFTLLNDDGRFTPGRTSSPYYPHVLPGVRVRVTLTVSGTAYQRFDGYVDSWGQGWDGGGPASVVRVAATDILARFGTQQPLKPLYVEEVLLDTPTALWPLTEAAGATSAGSITTTVQAPLTVTVSADVTGGDATFGDGTGIPNDGLSCLTLNTSLTSAAGDDLKGYYLTGGSVATLGSTFSLESWVKVDVNMLAAMSRHTNVGSPNPVPLIAVTDASGNITGGLCLYDLSGAIILGFLTTSNTAAAWTVTWMGGSWSLDLNDGRTHHLAISVAGGTASFYVDGAQLGFGSAVTAMTAGQVHVGGYVPANWLYGQAPNFRGTIEYAAIYPTALSSARVAAHYSAAEITGSERTDTHVTRLLSYRPNTGTSLDIADGTVGAHDTTGTTLQQALLDTAKAEGGLLYVDGQGRVVLKKRSTQYNPAVAVTLDASVEQITADVGFHIDTQQLTNDVTVTRQNGASQRIIDTTSQNTYGVRASSDTLIVATDGDALDAAGWRLANNKDAKPRSPNLSVDLQTEPSTTVAQNVLAVTPWSRVAVTNLPAVAPSTTTTVWVQGWSEQIGVDTWTVTFNTTPLPLQALVWDSGTAGLWDTDVWAW